MKTQNTLKQKIKLPQGGRNIHHDPCIEPEIVMTLGLPFHRTDAAGALSECARLLDQDQPKHIVTANADFVAKAWKSPELRRIITGAHRILCDGQPIVWMSALLGRRLPERVTGSDLTPRLLELAANTGDGVFIFGTDEETLDSLRVRLRETYPGLNLAGAIAPPYGPIESWDNARYVNEIRRSGAKLLLVCLGFPKQDVWIDRYLKKIGTVQLAIGIGASLDFIAGKQIRAPKFFQAAGLEWLWRLIQDPRRMVGRYADDFACLLTIGGLQLRRRICPGKEPGRKVRLLNGVSLKGTQIVEPHEVGKLSSRFEILHTSSMVLDCQNETHVTGELMSDIVTMWRFCQQNKIKLCLFNTPASLVRHLGELRLSQFVPSFRHPFSVQAWAGTTDNQQSCQRISIRVPNRIDHEHSFRDFLFDVKELIEHTPGQIESFHLDLSVVENLSIPSAVRIAALQKQLGAGRLGKAPAQVFMTNARPEVSDVMEILGLMEEMEAAADQLKNGEFYQGKRPNAIRDGFSPPKSDGLVLPS